MSDASRERFRSALLAQISPRYSPLAHVCTTAGIGLAVVTVALARLTLASVRDLWIVPATLVVANVFEWTLHREVLHRPRLGGFIYGKHTLEHHRLYRQDSMAVRDWRELKYVLLGAATFSVVAVAAAIVALIPALVFGADAGWLALATEAFYMICYELLHLSYHLPADHPVGRLGVIRKLGSHHARHHDPRLMRRWNLNVSIPIADWLFGTIAPKNAPSPAHDDRTFDD